MLASIVPWASDGRCLVPNAVLSNLNCWISSHHIPSIRCAQDLNGFPVGDDFYPWYMVKGHNSSLNPFRPQFPFPICYWPAQWWLDLVLPAENWGKWLYQWLVSHDDLTTSFCLIDFAKTVVLPNVHASPRLALSARMACIACICWDL
jgi:hypothetical protein